MTKAWGETVACLDQPPLPRFPYSFSARTDLTGSATNCGTDAIIRDPVLDERSSYATSLASKYSQQQMLGTGGVGPALRRLVER